MTRTATELATETTTRPTLVSGLHSQADLIQDLQSNVRLNAHQLAQLPNLHATHAPRVPASPAAAELDAIAITATTDPARRSVDEVLADRESLRFYSDAPIAATTAAAIVRAARHADATGWPDDTAAGISLDILVAARGIHGAAPAIYRLDHDRFVPLAPLPQHDAEELVLQVEFAYSPLIVMAIAPFADLLARWGDHGERLANTRAAAAIGAALHEANALGVAGSPFAGFLTSGLRRLIAVDGYANAQMFAASFGYPAEETQRIR